MTVTPQVYRKFTQKLVLINKMCQNSLIWFNAWLSFKLKALKLASLEIMRISESESLPPSSLNPTSESTFSSNATDYYRLEVRDPSSIGVMTTNFRHLVSVLGLVFFLLQDRIEEIMIQRKISCGTWNLRPEAWLVEKYCVNGIIVRLLLFVLILIYPWTSDSFVKVRFFKSTFNTAPSTSNHDWDYIGDVPVSSDFIVIFESCILYRGLSADNTLSSSVPPIEDSIVPWQSKIQSYVRYYNIFDKPFNSLMTVIGQAYLHWWDHIRITYICIRLIWLPCI